MLIRRLSFAFALLFGSMTASGQTLDAWNMSSGQGNLVDGKWVLSSVEARGDFDVDSETSREDVTSEPATGVKQTGLPLSLTIRVFAVDAAGVRPLRACMVDIRHANALGESPADHERWLTGHRVTNHEGNAHFQTIIPGWNAGRAPRIDVRLRTFSSKPDGVQTLTWSAPLFLPDAIGEAAARVSPYKNNVTGPVFHIDDAGYQSRCGDRVCGLFFEAQNWVLLDGCHATLDLYVDAATTL